VIARSTSQCSRRLPYHVGMTATIFDSAEHAAGWCATLALAFTGGEPRTRLTTRRHVGPLLVQRPFYPEGDVCHVYLVHPPGGIVGGDQLQLSVAAGPGARVLLTTPAATKFYRAAPGLRAQLAQELTLTAATLEWLPQENIYFRGAQARVTTRINLDRQSRFIGWEIGCYGRPAGEELFTAGSLSQDFELWCEDRPLLLDHLRLDGAAVPMQAPWGLAGCTALGSLLAYPATQADVAALRELREPAGTLSASVVDGVLVCRAGGAQGEDVRRRLSGAWQCLRPRILQREALAPRIWST
jgi:urease accessory protein